MNTVQEALTLEFTNAKIMHTVKYTLLPDTETKKLQQDQALKTRSFGAHHILKISTFKACYLKKNCF